MRGDYLEVTVFLLDFAEELLQAVAQGGSFRKPEGQAGADVGREREQLHLLAELAVVALLRFLEKLQVLVEHLLLGEGDAVDAHELVALFVAAPVGSGEAHHLAGLDDARRGDVRAAAEVCEVPLGVGGDMAVLKLRDKLALVFPRSCRRRMSARRPWRCPCGQSARRGGRARASWPLSRGSQLP